MPGLSVLACADDTASRWGELWAVTATTSVLRTRMAATALRGMTGSAGLGLDEMEAQRYSPASGFLRIAYPLWLTAVTSVSTVMI